MLPYPFNYFSSLIGFRKTFANRRMLSWFQLIFTSVFLISLSLIPVAIQTASLTSYALDTFINKAFDTLDEDVMLDLDHHAQIKDHVLTTENPEGIHHNAAGTVIIGHHEELKLGKELTLYFDKENLKITKEGKELANIRYQAIDQKALKSKEALTKAISKDWFQQNRLVISLFLVLSAGFLFSINFAFLALGASFLLYLTKKSRLFSFRTFKECYHFILNCLGLPTIIGLICGLFGQSLPTIITVQNILFVLYLVIIFYKTHFRDEDFRN